MKLRVFTYPAKRWIWNMGTRQSLQAGVQGQILTEVIPTTDDTRQNDNRERGWIGCLQLLPSADPTTTALECLQDLNLPWKSQQQQKPTPTATHPGKQNKNNDSDSVIDLEPFPKMILLQPPIIIPPENDTAPSSDESTWIPTTLDYLREALPASAKCLERYAAIGGPDQYGRTNAHGKPLDTHAAGICHDWMVPSQNNDGSSTPAMSISNLAALLDVYPPLRLALSASNFAASNGDNHRKDYNDDEWEVVMENTDMILYRGDDATKGSTTTDGSSSITTILDRWKQIWDLQHQNDQCRETYATCPTERDARELLTLFEEHLNATSHSRAR